MFACLPSITDIGPIDESEQPYAKEPWNDVEVAFSGDPFAQHRIDLWLLLDVSGLLFGRLRRTSSFRSNLCQGGL
jgi:hypothetical protein